MWYFIAGLCLKLQQEDPEWRSNTVLLLDNASYHTSDYMIEKFQAFSVPVLFSGPYSYDAAPVEKVFAAIKTKDLNPQGRSF